MTRLLSTTTSMLIVRIVSKRTEAELRENICDEKRCWRTQRFEESEVTADLGGPWRILLLDDHFKTCSKKRLGKHCDGVAVYPQESNKKLKFLELKQSLRALPDAKAQLIVGVESVAAKLPAGFADLDVEAELHVRQAGTSTAKLRWFIMANNRKIPIKAYRNGKQV
jgi:hypothetical protein